MRLYRTEKRFETVLLAVTAALITFLILLFLFYPELRLVHPLDETPLVRVVIDSSSSMDLPFDYNRTRREYANELVNQFRSEYLPRLEKQGVRCEILEFDGNRETDSSRVNGTNIFRALRSAAVTGTGESLKSILLITDGGQTEEDVLDRSLPPVSVIPAIGAEGVRDVSVEAVRFPEIMFTDREDSFTVKVRQEGLIGEEAKLVVKSGEEVLYQKLVTLEADGSDIVVSLTRKKQGNFPVEVSIEQFPGELLTSNNTVKFNIDILKDKIRVISISGRPRWEYRFLRTLLKQDPKIELVSFVILREPEQLGHFSNDELSLIRFPYREILFEKLNDFDLLIFDNFDYYRFFQFFPGNFTPTYLNEIEKFVRKGGGFLILGGSKSFKKSYRNTALERLSPLISLNVNSSYIDRPFKMTVAERSYRHPVLGGVVPEQWQNYPDLLDYNRTGGLAPGARALGYHPVEQAPDGSPLPIMAVREVGAGRVMALATGSTFRWNFISAGQGQANIHYYQFFHKAIRWLIHNPELEPVRLHVTRQRLRPGQTQKFDIYAFDQYYEPLKNAKVKVAVTGPDGTRYVPVPAEQSFPGQFSFEFRPEHPGLYEVRGTVFQNGKQVKVLKQKFTVTGAGRELLTGLGNRELAVRIARESGGSVLEGVSSLEDFYGETLDRISRTRVYVETRYRWWNRSSILLLVTLLAVLHWLLRKRWTGR